MTGPLADSSTRPVAAMVMRPSPRVGTVVLQRTPLVAGPGLGLVGYGCGPGRDRAKVRRRLGRRVPRPLGSWGSGLGRSGPGVPARGGLLRHTWSRPGAQGTDPATANWGTDEAWHLRLPRSGDSPPRSTSRSGACRQNVPAPLVPRMRASSRSPARPRLRGAQVRREYALRTVRAPPGAGLRRPGAGDPAGWCAGLCGIEPLRGRPVVARAGAGVDGGVEDLLDVVEEHLLAAGASPAAAASKLEPNARCVSPEEETRLSAKE